MSKIIQIQFFPYKILYKPNLQLVVLLLGVVDFVKAGYHMRRAWKMYEKCHREIHGFDPEVSNKKNKVFFINIYSHSYDI